jgi:hypothetical protein
MGPQFSDRPRQILGVVSDFRETDLDEPATPRTEPNSVVQLSQVKVLELPSAKQSGAGPRGQGMTMAFCASSLLPRGDKTEILLLPDWRKASRM